MQPYGRVLDNDANTLWLSHTHNYYWRLDFDLGESANDDVVSETRYELGAQSKALSASDNLFKRTSAAYQSGSTS
ncbi:MAG: hypothetical protein ACJA0Z_001804 [Halioglobus sp.]|jgi:hypothetical protein